MTPVAKRKAAGGLRKAAGGLQKTRPASERRICRLLGLHRSTARSRPDPERGDGPLADRLRELARRHPRYGYLTLHHMLKREGLVVNRKRTHRVYARLGLQVRTKRRRRLWRPRVRMAMRFWSERSGAALNFIQPGKPTQNAFVESFNGKFRDSCLNQHWFRGLADVRRIVDDWRHHYNHERPHSSLGYSTPAERAKQAA